MKRLFFFVLGWICLVMAYIGIITPGIPFSIFLIGAAYCFSKSSQKWHDWLYSHKFFGPFLTNWQKKRVFPTRFKFAMIIVMSSSLWIIWHSTGNVRATVYTGLTMLAVAIWAWKYPGSVEEYDRRKATGKSIGWIK